MNSKILYREIGLIDDDLIMEADMTQMADKIPSAWRNLKVGAYAAVIFFCLMVLPSIIKESGVFGEIGKRPGGVTPPPHTDKTGLIFYKASEIQDKNQFIEGHFWQDLSEAEIQAVLPDLPIYNSVATAHFQGDGTVVRIDVQAETKSGIHVYIQLAPAELNLDYMFESTPEASIINGVSVNAGYYEGELVNLYFANFQTDGGSYYIELQVKPSEGKEIENAKEILEELVYRIIKEERANFSVLQPVIPELREEQLSLQQAYADIDFGTFLPDEVPNGFAFDSSIRFVNQEQNYLSAAWYHGYREIRWRVMKFLKSDVARMTSVAETQNYDLALYPIPRADFVPENLRNIVDNPIFRIDELTMDTVEARAAIVTDQGDVSGYRMHFSVLFEKDILVELTVKGADPEYVYKQLQMIAQKNKS